MNLLIVDDDMIAVDGLKAAIQKEALGIERIFCAYRILEAKKFLEEEKITIAIFDIEMPSGNGLDLLEWTKKRSLPCAIILLTNYAEFHYAQQAVHLGALEYLLKPATDEQINKSIKKAANILKEKGVLKEEEEGIMNTVACAVQYIEDHLNTLVSRDEVAQHVNMNVDYLSRIFKKEKHLSLGAYITSARIKKAEHLLKNTEIPVGKVAEMVGYTNFSHFSSCFKSEYLVSPTEFRKLRGTF